MTEAVDIFGGPRALVGMVHVAALPGTPRARWPLGRIAERAVEEARRLEGAGFDAILLENMHDVPYLRREVGPEIVAGMTAVGEKVRAAVRAPLGVQVLAGANRAALAVAHAIEGTFIRAEGFAFAAVADEGLLDEADAGPLLRYRRTIGAEEIRILADVKKKHSAHAITADVDLAETARAAAFLGADALVVSGPATGAPTRLEDIDAVREATPLPVVVGSGATAGTILALLQHADAVIVGSTLKRDGHWANELDPERISAFVRAARP